MFDLIEESKICFVTAPKDYSSAAATAEFLNLENYTDCYFIIQTGAWAGGTAAVTLDEANNASGTSSGSSKNSNLAFSTYWTNDGSTSKNSLTKTSCSSTFNLDTASAIYVIRVRAKELSDGYNFINLDIASPGANSDFYSVIAILTGTRYAQSTPIDAIT